jgi:hypothetical protein
MKTTIGKRPTDKASRELDLKAALAMAEVESVALAAIDLEDTALCVRDQVDSAFDVQDVIVDDGAIDLAGDHAVVLQPRDDRFRIVSGFRRLRALNDGAEISTIRCLVLGHDADAAAELIAARHNLMHGKQLRTSEKRNAFRLELSTHESRKLDRPSDRAWARIYGVSPTTIGSWTREMDVGRSVAKGKDTGDDTVTRSRSTGAPTSDASSGRRQPGGSQSSPEAPAGKPKSNGRLLAGARKKSKKSATSMGIRKRRTVDEVVLDLEAIQLELCVDLAEEPMSEHLRTRICSACKLILDRASTGDREGAAA